MCSERHRRQLFCEDCRGDGCRRRWRSLVHLFVLGRGGGRGNSIRGNSEGDNWLCLKLFYPAHCGPLRPFQLLEVHPLLLGADRPKTGDVHEGDGPRCSETKLPDQMLAPVTKSDIICVRET